MLIIKIPKLSDNKVEDENGGRSGETLSQIRLNLPQMDKVRRFEYLQNFSFRLLEPLFLENLEIYSIDIKNLKSFRFKND